MSSKQPERVQAPDCRLCHASKAGLCAVHKTLARSPSDPKQALHSLFKQHKTSGFIQFVAVSLDLAEAQILGVLEQANVKLEASISIPKIEELLGKISQKPEIDSDDLRDLAATALAYAIALEDRENAAY
mgnify:FL=1